MHPFYINLTALNINKLNQINPKLAGSSGMVVP